MDLRNVDWLDIFCIIIGFIIVANFPGAVILPVILLVVAQSYFRRKFNWRTIKKQEEVVVESNWIGESETKQLTVVVTPETLPQKVSFAQIPAPLHKYDLPVGKNISWVWLNLLKDVTHVLIAGQSGSGKDNLLRLWVASLTRSLKPFEVQFAIIDGKGEWQHPGLVKSAYMFVPPAGGIDILSENWKDILKESRSKMESVLESVFKEMVRRQQLFNEANVIGRDRYIEKTKRSLPIIVVIATDIASDLEKDLNKLMEIIIQKGRSLGIRVLISVQTPSGMSTQWRTNLSVVISGKQQQASQDYPTMGVPVETMPYRPSALPNPVTQPGVMIMRKGQDWELVQTPYLPESVWEQVCDSLPVKITNNKLLLESLL